jgi:hypothetical protein
MQDWAAKTGHPPATPHAFRKTALQHARSGEDLNRQVAHGARLSESVMMGHYVIERDEEMRQASNRTYHRILLSPSLEVATRYGYRPDDETADPRKAIGDRNCRKGLGDGGQTGQPVQPSKWSGFGRRNA